METKWIKTGKVHDFVFLGKDVIATASGNYIIFYNLTTKERTIEYFNDISRGEGASCLAGHAMIPVFSTAERCCKPKIYIHTYPEIKKIAECELNEFSNSYLSCCFVGTEYLLSLTSFPKFQLMVWMWRSGQKLASIDSNLRSDIQIIQPSINSSHLIYQFAPVLGKLLLYEIHAHSKNITIIKNEVKSIKNKISFVCWTKDNNLLLSDVFKNVYILTSDGKNSQLILQGNLDVNIENQILILPFYAGFIIVNDQFELTCYNKSFTQNNICSNWNITWSIKCESQPLKMTHARHKEAILLSCDNGKVLELHLTHDSKPEFEEIINDGEKTDLILLLKPDENHIILASKSSNCLTMSNIFDGNINAKYTLKEEDQITDFVAHPNQPLLAACVASGKCICFTACDEKLEILKTIHLHQESLDRIKFSENGYFLGTVSMTTNTFFLLLNSHKNRMNVLTYLSLKNTIIDFLIYDINEKITLLTLLESSLKTFVGNCIEIISIINVEKTVIKTHKICMPNYYQNLNCIIGSDLDFVAMPYLKKQLHLFKIQENHESFELTNILPVEHKIRNFSALISKYYILTSGYDGFVILRQNSKPLKIIATHMAHHYREKGTKDVVISVKNGVIVASGKNGSVIGLQTNDLSEEFEVQSLSKLKHFEAIVQKYDNDKLPLPNQNETWLEQKNREEYENIRNEITSIKYLISEDLGKLKAKIKGLLDTNETKSAECQLSISSFDLNKKRRQNEIEIALRNQDEKQTCLRETIMKKDLVIKYLMQKFWDSMKVHDCTLVSFSRKVLVNNFSLFLEECEQIYDSSITLFNTPLYNPYNDHNYNKEQSNIDLSFIENDVSEPFKKLNEYLSSHYRADISFSGSTSSKWIDDDNPQNQIVKAVSNDFNCHILVRKENKLKTQFNEEFEGMTSLKKLLLKDVFDCIHRLIYYKNELKNLFNIFLESNRYENIKWCSIESPENVIKITNEDGLLEIQPNDDSMNADEKLDHISKTVDKTNLKNYYDNINFRKEKLDEMMDGSLEIRWEDEVKKEIPKPSCLISKNPAMYDEKDLEMIKVYKEKVKELETLRLKYKNHLESEVHNLNCKIEADIKNFDEKLEEFALKKINVKSAILQEFLLRLREQRIQFLIKYDSQRIFSVANNNLMLSEEEHKKLTQEVYIVESELIELRNKYENLNKRDKMLEGKFKAEFSELKQPLVEHLLRQYKRRPKIAKITCTSRTFLEETNECLIAGKKSSILPQDYLDFLRGMDALDVMPNGLPPQIEGSHWQALCKLRRSKVEMEIKIRIVALELAETEQTFFHLQKLVSFNQSKLLTIRSNIEEETLKQSRFLKNREIQLVLKAAQIEIVTSGYSSDLKNATVVTCGQLIQVNDDIIDRGHKKINAMRALSTLKKSILFNDWKYQFMFKKLKHLKKHLIILRNTKISKNMQKYLVERRERKIRFKDVISCEKMLKSVNKKFQRMEHEQKSNLLTMIDEIKHWSDLNFNLKKEIESKSSMKQTQILSQTADLLFKRNQKYHKRIIHMIMKRTELVENIKTNSKDLMNAQAQLELLKLKTYPILHYNYYFNKNI